MTLSVTHARVSTVAPAPSPTRLVTSTDWNAGHVITGTLDATNMPGLTGDVTSSAGSVSTTVVAIRGTPIVGTTGNGNIVFSNQPGLVGTVAITGGIPSTSPTTGTLTVSGGVGITGAINAGGAVTFPDGATWSSSGLNDTATYNTVSTPVVNFIPRWNFTSTANGLAPLIFSPALIPAGVSAGNISGTAFSATVDASAVNVNIARAFISNLNILVGYTGTIASAVTFQCGLGNAGTNPIAAAAVLQIGGISNGNGLTSGTVTNVGLDIQGTSISASGVGGTLNLYNARITLNNPTSLGTTNIRGIYITGNGGSGGTTTNYAIYSDSTAASSLAGLLTVTSTGFGLQQTASAAGNIGLQITNSNSAGNATVFLLNDIASNGFMTMLGSASSFGAGVGTFNFGTIGSITAAWLTNSSPRIQIAGAGNIYCVSATTTASAANVFMNNASTPANELQRVTSSVRYKRAIIDLQDDEADRIVAAARPIKYQSKCAGDDPDQQFIGLIAEEIAEIDERFVSRAAEGWGSVQYERLIVPLLSVVRRQQQRIEALEGAV